MKAKTLSATKSIHSRFKLIFIYGPPAAGKLTVAKELSKLTGYNVLHNQLTIDFLKEFFGREQSMFTKAFNILNSKMRYDLIDAAAKDKYPGLIFTFCYVKKMDDAVVKKIVDMVEKKHHGKVYFVQLKCSRAELMKRVAQSSRKNYHKIKSPESLEGALNKYELFHPIDLKKIGGKGSSMKIDNTKVSAKMVAVKIKKHFGI